MPSSTCIGHTTYVEDRKSPPSAVAVRNRLADGTGAGVLRVSHSLDYHVVRVNYHARISIAHWFDDGAADRGTPYACRDVLAGRVTSSYA
jgi:hypothetical protein